jgi:hypothetical protein
VNTALYAGLWLLVAQAGAPARDGQEETAPPPTAGPYHGVVPGPDARNPLPRPRSDPPRLIWTGFKMAGERSEIFLQTTRPVVHELSPGAGKAAEGKPAPLSVLLRNCRIHMRNNARRIDTRFFATPVEGVSARQRRKDVELNIALKDSALPEIRIEPGPDGSQFLVLSFPAGQPAAQPASTGVAPPVLDRP